MLELLFGIKTSALALLIGLAIYHQPRGITELLVPVRYCCTVVVPLPDTVEGLSKVAVPVLSDCKTIVPLLLSELDIVNCLLLGNVRLDPELITILPTVVFAVNETPALLLIVRLFRLAGSSTDDVCDDEPLYSKEPAFP